MDSINEITLWSTLLLEKLVVVQLMVEFLAFFATAWALVFLQGPAIETSAERAKSSHLFLDPLYYPPT
jgi:hypothetical protein